MIIRQETTQRLTSERYASIITGKDMREGREVEMKEGGGERRGEIRRLKEDGRIELMI